MPTITTKELTALKIAKRYHHNDLLFRGSEAEEKEIGELFRLEGKDYVIKEADIVYFRSNV